MSQRDMQPHVQFFQGELRSRLPITAWESLTHALQTGAEWWEGEALYGESVMVRCRTITDVRYLTAAALEAIEADNQEDQFA